MVVFPKKNNRNKGCVSKITLRKDVLQNLLLLKKLFQFWGVHSEFSVKALSKAAIKTTSLQLINIDYVLMDRVKTVKILVSDQECDVGRGQLLPWTFLLLPLAA